VLDVWGQAGPGQDRAFGREDKGEECDTQDSQQQGLGESYHPPQKPVEESQTRAAQQLSGPVAGHSHAKPGQQEDSEEADGRRSWKAWKEGGKLARQ